MVVAGKYEGEDDGENSIMFTGEGGRVTGKDQQTKPQVMTKGNAALLVSCATGNAIRLTRGSKAPFGPTEGYCYDGVSDTSFT